MRILAGTGKGVFAIEDSNCRQVLESRGVRDMVRLSGRHFAGTGDGLYVSDDQGENWQFAGLAGSEVWQTRAAADGILYAGTAPAGLYRSTDNGDTWEEIAAFSRLAEEAGGWGIPLDPPVPGRARAIVADATDAKHLWVGVEVGGIAETRDGGDTWQMILPGNNPDLHMMCAHPDNPEVLFASTGYGRPNGVADMIEGNAGVFRSDDAGRQWTYAWRGITPRYSRPMCIDHRAPWGLTVASAPTAFSSYRDDKGAQAMLFRSEDGGESWRPLCDAPSAANFHGLAIDPERSGGVFVGTDMGEVWRVGNDARWEQCASGLPAVLALCGSAH